MAVDSFQLIIISVICWIIFLFFLFRFMERSESRRNRFIFPVAVVFIIAITGSLLAVLFDGAVVAFMLTIPLPTLAIFTVLPVIQTTIDWKGKGKDIAAFSVCYSIVFFLYFALSNFSGVDMIFLTIFSPLPTDNLLLKMFIVILFNYAELVAIAGLIIAVPCFLVYYYSSRR